MENGNRRSLPVLYAAWQIVFVAQYQYVTEGPETKDGNRPCFARSSKILVSTSAFDADEYQLGSEDDAILTVISAHDCNVPVLTFSQLQE
jgi:hypothetical protein